MNYEDQELRFRIFKSLLESTQGHVPNALKDLNTVHDAIKSFTGSVPKNIVEDGTFKQTVAEAFHNKGIK